MEKTTLDSTNLLTSLREANAGLLNAAGIYSVLDYAWEDEDTPSSDYVGLAMWTTDAPFEPRWNVWDRTSSPSMPTERDEIFYKAGEDFIGTMELAKNAIGLVLYSFEHRKPDNIMDDVEPFWEYRASAAIWLNIASDRIRDFFVMARFGITAKEYAKLHEKNGLYARPFRMHDATETKSAKQTALSLVKDAEALGRLRHTRNEIVHNVASRQGSNAVASLKTQKDEAARFPYVQRSSEDALLRRQGWNETIELLNNERRKELEDAIQVLKDWYMLLIRASGLVFEFEYWKRIKK
jgi:hypothetical protein